MTGSVTARPEQRTFIGGQVKYGEENTGDYLLFKPHLMITYLY